MRVNVHTRTFSIIEYIKQLFAIMATPLCQVIHKHSTLQTYVYFINYIKNYIKQTLIHVCTCTHTTQEIVGTCDNRGNTFITYVLGVTLTVRLSWMSRSPLEGSSKSVITYNNTETCSLIICQLKYKTNVYGKTLALFVIHSVSLNHQLNESQQAHIHNTHTTHTSL